jgi:flagellar L-ring protein precursor FlgH
MNKRKNNFRESFWLAVFLAAFAMSGCASLGKAWHSLFGKDQAEAPHKTDATRFSKQDNMKVGSARKYRMTKERMEQESDLGQGAGSLWMMEGQSAYLFSPNTSRLIGDLLNVKLEGAPQKQLQTKVKVIARLLERIDHPESTALRNPASQQNQQAANPTGQAPAAGAPANPANPAAGAAANGAAPPAAADEAPSKADAKFDVASVPTRITEILKDGSYRVKGIQPFMIGKREYKAIVTGIVRPEDFNDDGINASKLLDSQFDIVNNKKAQTL